MFSFEPKDLPQQQVHSFLVGGVAPRPIALVSTISADGIPNLSPFSFFNAFGSNPPVVAFSASRRGRDASLKDTYNNMMATGECVINAVTQPILEQINLASTEYGSDINEWEKCGLSPIKSDIVKPSRAMESPFQMECKLYQMVNVGAGPASANIAICEVVKFHVSEDIMENGRIVPSKIHHIGRNGGDYWSDINEKSLFILKKPHTKNNIGFDGLPGYIRNSKIFSSNNLARFGLLETFPEIESANKFIEKFEPLNANISEFNNFQLNGDLDSMLRSALFNINEPDLMEITAREFLENYKIQEAFYICMYNNQLKNKSS